MHVYRWMGCLTSLLAATAYAEPPASGVDDRLDGCEGIPARARMARYESVGEDAVHAVARSGDRYLVFPHEDGIGCVVYPIGRAAARVDGNFGSATKAFVLRPRRCAAGSCTIALAVRGKDERPTMALRTEADCDDSVELHSIKLFSTRESIELVCHASSGAGWQERRVIYDVSEDTLVTLYSLDTGSYIAPTSAEKKKGICASCPVGSIRVEKAGETPLLRVVDPASGTLHDGKGTLPARQLGYDAKRHTFTPTGAADIPTVVDAHVNCKRR